MKKDVVTQVSIAVWTLALIGFVAAPALAASAKCLSGTIFNEPDGFRGITWGTPLSKVAHQMVPAPTQQPNWYRRLDDRMVLGEIQLVELYYEFYDGKFSAVVMKSAPHTQSGMIAAFKAQFGNCVVKDYHKEEYVWLPGSIGWVFLGCDQPVYACIGSIYSELADKKKKADKAAAAVRAKKDF